VRSGGVKRRKREAVSLVECAKQKGNKTGKAPRVEGSENLPAKWMRGCVDARMVGKAQPKAAGTGKDRIASGRLP